MSQGNAEENLLTALSLSLSEAAIVARTSEDGIREDYLNKTFHPGSHDEDSVFNFIRDAKIRNPNLDLTTVTNYLEKQGYERCANLVREICIIRPTLQSLSRYQELWVFCSRVSRWPPKPDTFQMQLYPQILELGVAHTKFVFGTLEEEEAFITAIPELKGKTDTDSSIPGLPHMIIGNPKTDADLHMHFWGEMILVTWLGGPRLATLLLHEYCFLK